MYSLARSRVQSQHRSSPFSREDSRVSISAPPAVFLGDLCGQKLLTVEFAENCRGRVQRDSRRGSPDTLRCNGDVEKRRFSAA